MNGAILLIVGIVFFVLAYHFYGRFLEKLFGVDVNRPTPAHTKQDNVDYIPTRPTILFGHHFASIAGAGPIVGPVLAAYLGWAPVVLWILLGCVFIGAMHDFSALFVSVRNEGKSIGSVIEKYLGYSGRQIFLSFCWAALILVIAIFALLVAKTFVLSPSVATASLLFIIMAPVFGYLVYRKGMSIIVGSFIFVPLLFIFVWVGTVYPLDIVKIFNLQPEIAKKIWIGILLVYVFVASVMPVWLLLQPRDYLNSYLLYVMLFVGVIGVFVAAPHFVMPAFTGWSTTKPGGGIGHLFPVLYVTVACGACSGFHSLVASGTTSKQLNNEKHIRTIGYGAMLVEGILALVALTTVAVLSKDVYISKLASVSPITLFATGLSSFTAKLGIAQSIGLTFAALAISAFMLTTLDTATRLARFTWQELFLPSSKNQTSEKKYGVLSHPLLATTISVFLAGYMAFSGNAMEIWPVFGASNQMLAALTLLVITLMLVRRKTNFRIALIPMLFMGIITIWALFNLVKINYNKNFVLLIATIFLLIMALTLAVKSVLSLLPQNRISDT